MNRPEPRGQRRSVTALAPVRAAAAIAPVRPAYAAGLRAAIATVLPLMLAQLSGDASGTWLALGGFTGALADKGGSYRTRAETIGALALAGAAATALGTLAGPHHGVAAPLTFVIALACSIARAWGNPGASVGVSVLNMFVIALDLPPAAPDEALVRAAQVLVGALWAMLVALVLWPLRPYRPVRLAVARVHATLAAYADQLATQIRGEAPDSLQLPGLEMRRALEDARGVLAATRRGRPAESERGERLIVLHEAADQIYGHLLALGEGTAGIPAARRDRAAQEAIGATLMELAATARGVAESVEEERGTPRLPVEWSGGRVRAAAETLAEPAARDAYDHAATVLDRVAQYARVAAATVATLNQGGPPPEEAPAGARVPLDPGPTAAARLRAAVAPGSILLRHGLRLAVVTSAAVVLTRALGLQRGYWVTITVVLIMQPYTGLTSLRALQRVAGTVLGGVLTAALGALFHDPIAILPLAFAFSGIAVALLPLNYAVFSVFLTPTFVLLAEASTGDWHLAGLRIVNTMIGGGLALLGARLLWPSPEHQRVPGYLAAALRAVRDYLDLAIRLFGDGSEAASRQLRDARREVGLAVLNADESVQRLLAEHPDAPEMVAPLMAFLTYCRRFTASTASLALARFAPGAPPPGALHPFGDAARRVLDDLIQAVLEERPPATLPTMEEAAALVGALPDLTRERVDRLARQLRSLHQNAARWLAMAGAGTGRAPSPLAGADATT